VNPNYKEIIIVESPKTMSQGSDDIFNGRYIIEESQLSFNNEKLKGLKKKTAITKAANTHRPKNRNVIKSAKQVKPSTSKNVFGESGEPSKRISLIGKPVPSQKPSKNQLTPKYAPPPPKKIHPHSQKNLKLPLSTPTTTLSSKVEQLQSDLQQMARAIVGQTPLPPYTQPSKSNHSNTRPTSVNSSYYFPNHYNTVNSHKKSFKENWSQNSHRSRAGSIRSGSLGDARSLAKPTQSSGRKMNLRVGSRANIDA
jgi:hypothetical protein